MKKLNRKGFTLIELLAVIVILAVVMVVTIPSVIKSMNNAREKSLENAANTVAEWFQKNYELSVMATELGTSTEAAYNTFVGTLTNSKLPTTADTAAALCTTTDGTRKCAVIEAAGVGDAATNIASGTVYLKGNKVCVSLTAAEKKSFWSTSASDHTKNSSGC